MPTAFGLALREVRHESSFPRRPDFADRVGVTQQTLLSYENRTLPSIRLLNILLRHDAFTEESERCLRVAWVESVAERVGAPVDYFVKVDTEKLSEKVLREVMLTLRRAAISFPRSLARPLKNRIHMILKTYLE